MGYLEVKKYGISAVMLDGYMPDFSELKKIDWDYASKNKLFQQQWAQEDFDRIRKHLEPDARNQSAIIRSEIYRKLLKSVRYGFCPYRKISKWPCHQGFHPSKGQMAMKYCYAVSLDISPEEAYKIFNADAEADMAKGKGEYATFFTIVDRRPETGCQALKECNRNWIDFLKFEPKKRKDYSDYEGFKGSAKKILKHHLRSSDSSFFDDRRLSRFFHDD